MEAKKTAWDHNTLWTFFNHWQFGGNFFGRKSFTNCFKSGAGFTLIELLITITLIGTLAAGIVTVINPLGQIQKARDASRKSDLSQIKNALEIYYQDNGRYPASSTTAPTNRIVNSAGAIPITADWGSTNFQPYMTTLPKDPNSLKNYVYVSPVVSVGQIYYLYASLDKAGDPQLCVPTGAPCANAIVNGVGAACGGNCNYGVSSSNVSP